jgi:cell division protein FtsB
VGSDGQPVERHAPSRAVFWIGPLAALLGAAFALFHDVENGLGVIPKFEAELDAADLRLDRLREERAELLLRAERLRTEPFEIEAVARESLGMARPGEIVVRLPSVAAPDARSGD